MTSQLTRSGLVELDMQWLQTTKASSLAPGQDSVGRKDCIGSRCRSSWTKTLPIGRSGFGCQLSALGLMKCSTLAPFDMKGRRWRLRGSYQVLLRFTVEILRRHRGCGLIR